MANENKCQLLPRSFQLEAQIPSWTNPWQRLQELLQVKWWIRQWTDHSRQLRAKPRAAPLPGSGMGDGILWAENSLQPPGGLGALCFLGMLSTAPHTLHLSAWTSCWWKKWDYPFVKREDKDVTGFGVKLWANQRLVLPGWGCSAGAVSGSRKEFWFLWAAKWAAWLQIKPIYSDNTQQQWVEVFWFPITQPFSTSGPWQQFLFSNWQFSAGVCRLRAHHITMAMKVGGFILSLPPLWVF